MKKTRLLVTLSLWVLLFASPALAGAPAVKLVITDLQNGSEIVVSEPALLGFFALFDFQKPLAEAPQVTGGIKIIRYWDTGPFDFMHYYFGTNGSPSSIYYDGGLGSDSEHKWYTANPESDQLLRTILGRQNEPWTARLPGVLVVCGLLILVVGVVGFFLYRFRRRFIRTEMTLASR